MTKTFWEKTRVTNRYTGYYFNAPELCRTKNYILRYNTSNTKSNMKVTNHITHEYTSTSPIEYLESLGCANNPLNETSFNFCLAKWYQNSLSLSHDYVASHLPLLTWTLSGNITLSNDIKYFLPDQITVPAGQPASKNLLGTTLQFTFKSDSSATLEISNHSLVTHSLSLENINLNVHDNHYPSIICAGGTCSISGGNHIFHHNFLGAPRFYEDLTFKAIEDTSKTFAAMQDITKVGVYDLLNVNYFSLSSMPDNINYNYGIYTYNVKTLCIYSDTIILTNGDYNFSENNFEFDANDPPGYPDSWRKGGDTTLFHTSLITSKNLLINDSNIIFNNNKNDTRSVSWLAIDNYFDGPFTTIICSLSGMISSNSTLNFTNNSQRYLIYQPINQMNIDSSLIFYNNLVLDTLITGYDISINTSYSDFSNNINVRTDPNNSLYLRVSEEVEGDDSSKKYIMGPQYANGGIISSSNKLHLSGNFTFKNNNVKGAGSVISANHINLTNNPFSQNILFEHNTTNILYSTVYSYDAQLKDNTFLKGNITLKGSCTFKDNSSGGAIKTTGSVFLLGDDSVFYFINNTSYDSGGAIYSYSPYNTDQKIRIEGNAVFSGNNSKKFGGAIYGRKLDVSTNYVIKIEKNMSYLFGGGVHVEALDITTIGLFQFHSNKSYYAGGGLVVIEWGRLGGEVPDIINLQHIDFSNNTTKYFSDFSYNSDKKQPNEYFISYDTSGHFEINTKEDLVKFLTFKSGSATLMSDISLYIPIWLDYFHMSLPVDNLNNESFTCNTNRYEQCPVDSQGLCEQAFIWDDFSKLYFNCHWNNDKCMPAIVPCDRVIRPATHTIDGSGYTIYGNGLNSFRANPNSDTSFDIIENFYPQSNTIVDMCGIPNAINKTHVFKGGNLTLNNVNLTMHNFFSSTLCSCLYNSILRNNKPDTNIHPIFDTDTCMPVYDGDNDAPSAILSRCKYYNGKMVDFDRLNFLNPYFNLIDRTNLTINGGNYDLCGNSTFFNAISKSTSMSYIDKASNLVIQDGSMTITKSLQTAINMYHADRQSMDDLEPIITFKDSSINFINNSRPFLYTEYDLSVISSTLLINNNNFVDKSIITINSERGLNLKDVNLSIQNNIPKPPPNLNKLLIKQYTAGIYKPVALITTNNYNMENVHGIISDNSISIFYNNYNHSTFRKSNLNFINNTGSAINGTDKLSIIDSSLTFRKNNKYGITGGTIALESPNWLCDTWVYKDPTSSGVPNNSELCEYGAGINIKVLESLSAEFTGILITGSNLYFDRNRVFKDGGAIWTNRNLTISDSSLDFSGNVSYNDGGAIWTNSNLTISDSSLDFSGNVSIDGGGGAIYSERGISLIDSNMTFMKNSSINGGGAIKTNNLGIVGDSYEFIDNIGVGDGRYKPAAGEGGGAISALNDIVITSNNLKFEGNIALAGGAIYSLGNTIINGSLIFSDNSASLIGGDIWGDARGSGGAIYSKNVYLNGDKFEFIHNYADINGGAIATNTLHLSGDIFEFNDNIAYALGGAIYSDSIIIDNSTADYTFTNNTVGFPIAMSDAPQGGAIYTVSSLHIASHSLMFKNNTSNYSGGAIYSKDDIILDGSATFRNNSSGSGGGAISGINIHLLDGPFEFSGNTSRINGGAIHADASLIIHTDHNVTFTSNTSNAGFGGAIKTNILHLSGGSFEFNDNTAENDGGAIYSESIIIDNLTAYYTFTGNKSNSGAGGAIFTEASLHMVADGLIFNNNISDSSGGAIYSKNDIYLFGYHDDDGTRTDYHIDFNDNSSGSVGGAIAGKNINLQGRTEYTFEGNTSKMNGGAIYADGSLSIIAYRQHYFNNNTSTAGFGGAIAANHISDMSSYYINFIENHAKQGGAIYTDTDLVLSSTYEGFNFTDNSSSADGGAIWAYPQLTLEGKSQFNNNISTNGLGGAIKTNTLHLSGGPFEFNDNAADKGGSDIFREYNYR